MLLDKLTSVARIAGAFRILVLILSVAIPKSVQAATQSRIALVIANQTYSQLEGAKLENPIRDGVLISQSLKKAGFSVDTVTNLTATGIREALGKFGERSRSADVALVYFAGIGFESNGAAVVAGTELNHLPKTPADFTIPEMVGIDTFVDSVRQARVLGLVFADAGRESMAELTRDVTIDPSRIIDEIARSNDVVILYSSSPGEEAQDGAAGSNSPFASAVAKYLLEPGLELSLFARKVRAEVIRATNGRQKPTIYGQLGEGEFYFAPTVAIPTKSDASLVLSSQPRLALIVGNSDYNRDGDNSDLEPAEDASDAVPVTDLSNGVNDARDVRDALTALGFAPVFLENADKARFEDALIQFGKRVRDAGPDAIVVIYYSGHGMQVEGANFLIPVGALLPSTDLSTLPAADAQLVLRRVAVSANDVLDRLRAPSDKGINVVILDACRNNPWERRVRGLSRGTAERGLADMRVNLRRTMLVFSTQPGNTALDGSGRNSPFTDVLKTYLPVPGKSARSLFDEVSAEVERKTRGRQIPFINSPSVGEVCLGSCRLAQ